MSDFERALPKVLAHEGGFANHPKDPGGATMKGVTQAVYDTYRKAKKLATRSVKYITDAELKEIYKSRYWDLVKGDKLPAGINYVVFDGAVNSGVSRSVKWLQRALGRLYTGPVDGVVGPATLLAVEMHPDHDALVDAICDLRLAFLKSLKTWPTFGKGWSARVKSVRTVGKALARGKIDVPAAPVQDASAKAYTDDVAAPPPVAPGDIATGGGTLGAILTQSISQLSPFQDNPAVANLILWLTVASMALAVAGVVYRMWASRKRAQVEEATA